MGKKIETRIYPVREFRVKQGDDGENILEGYSAVFNSPSEDMGWGEVEVREYVAQDAFTNALKNSDCRALFNHNPDFVLGRESANTLTLRQDEKGLFSRCLLPETTYAKNLSVLVARGDVREQSFAFTVARDQWEEDREKKIATRTILEIKELFDVSPVTYPAYPDTDVAKRSFERFMEASGATPGKNMGATARRLRDMDNKFKFLRSKNA